MNALKPSIETLEDRLMLSGDAPVVNSLNFVEADDGRVSALVVSFSEDVSASLDALDLTLLNSDTLTMVDMTEAELIVNGLTATWSFMYMTGFSLADGNYLGTLSATGISSDQGIALDGNADGTGGDDYSFSFASWGDATVSGTVFSDTDGDSLFEDMIDVPLDGWRVFVDADLDGAFDVGEDFCITDSDGAWSISALTPGDYRVVVEMPGQWLNDSPDTGYYDLTLASDEIADGLDFSTYLPNSISGRVFQDIDGDGIQDDGEEALSGWTVFIDADGDMQPDAGELTTVTDADGDYVFESMIAGTYIVAMQTLVNWSATEPLSGAHLVILTDGAGRPGRDFGFQSDGSSISGSLYVDFDADGAFDDGETPLANWVVFLDSNGDGQLGLDEDWMLSASDGSYAFTGLLPGEYIVAAAAQTGWDQTGPVGTVSASISFVQVLSDSDTGLEDLSRSVMTTQSPDGAHVYTAARGGDVWSVYVFAVDGETGELSFVQRISELDIASLNGVADIAFSPDGDYVYASCSLSGAITIFTRDQQSGVLGYIGSLDSGGTGYEKLAGASSITVSEDGEHLYVTGATANAVSVFACDSATGLLTLVQIHSDGELGVDGLAGAADSVLSPDGRHLYVASSTDGAIAVFSRNTLSGVLSFEQVIDSSDTPSVCLSYVASLAVSPDGMYVYAAATGSACLTIFSRDDTTGELTFSEMFRNNSGGVSGVDYPTDVAVSPDGRQIIVAGSVNYAFAEFTRTGDDHAFTTAIADDYVASIFPDIRTVEFSLDGRKLYVSGSVGSQIMVYSYGASDAYATDIELGEAVTNLDFGFAAQSGEISGVVWLDLNGDGVKDAAEPGLAGWVLYIDGVSVSSEGFGSAAVQSNAAGAYSFANLPAGVHTVTLHMPDGWVNTLPGGAVKLVDLVSGNIIDDVNFGAVMPGEISGTVFEDSNRDGIQDIAEAALPGVTVFIDENFNGMADSGEPQIYSDTSGYFSFGDLTAGIYRIGVVLSEGLVASSPIGGAYTVMLDTGESETDLVFAAYRLGSIAGNVWHDLNGDALIDLEEESLAGWTVFVDSDGDGSHDAGELSAVTDAEGNYALENLAPGDYTLRLIVQSGWKSIESVGDSLALTLGSGVSMTEQNFPVAVPVSITGTLWYDSDGDNEVDDEDEAIEGWTVFLDADGDGLLSDGEMTATSSESGYYEFTQIDPGNHTVCVDVPSGWWAGDSGWRSDLETLSGDSVTDLNFGLRQGVEFEQGEKAKYTDPDGVKIVVSSTRLVAGRIYLDPGGYVAELYVIPSDGRGDVKITISGSDMLFVSRINIPGTIDSFTAPDIGLEGGQMVLDGSLGRLRLGDVRDSELIFNQDTLDTGNSDAMRIELGSVSDSSLDTGGAPIDSLEAIEWLDTDQQSDTITAPSIDDLDITGARAKGDIAARSGDMQADLILDGGDPETPSEAELLGKADIAGSVSGQWDINGDAGRIDIDGQVEDFDLSITGDADMVRAGNIVSGDMSFGGHVDDIQADAWGSGSLTADSVDSLRITGNRSDDVAGDFGANVDIPATQLEDGQQAVRRIDVAGDVTGGTWNIADDFGRVDIAGDVSSLTAAIMGALERFDAGSVSETDLAAQGAIDRIRVIEWLGGAITADTLELLQTTGDRAAELAGDFEGDLELAASQPLKGDLAAKQILIGGDLLSGEWLLASGARKIEVEGDISDLNASVAGDVDDLTAGSVTASDFSASGDIDNVVVINWLDGSLAADQIGTLKAAGDKKADIAGDFGADLTALAADSDGNEAIRKLLIAGDVTGGQWDIGDDIKALSFAGDISDLTLNIDGDLGSLLANSVSNTNLSADGECGRIMASQWQGGCITADSIGLLKTTGDKKAEIAGDFDADLAIGGDQTGAGDNAVKQIYIAGSGSDMNWDIGGNVDVIIVLGDLSSLTAQIDGDLDSFRAENVNDSTLDADGLIGLLDVLAWLGGDISAAGINKLLAGSKSNADSDVFSANLALDGEGLASGDRTLGRADIDGNIPSGNWNLNGGDSGVIDVLGDISGWSLNSSDLTSLKAASVDSSDIAATGDVGTVYIDEWADGSLAAGSLGTFKATGDKKADIAGDFTGDLAVAGDVKKIALGGSASDADWSVDGSLKSLSVGDDMSDVTLLCGENSGSSMSKLYIVGIAENVRVLCSGSISSIVLGGCFGSDFLAGVDVEMEGRHVEFADDFINPDAYISKISVSGFRVTGEQSDRFASDSNFSAPYIASAKLRNVSADNETVGFFVDNDGRQIKSLKYIDNEQPDWLWKPGKGDVPGSGNVFVRPVGDSFSPVLTPDQTSVNEGSQVSFQVTLSSDPVVETAVSVIWTDGDSDLSVLSGAELVFDSTNWDQPQTVTIASAEDDDNSSDWADFTVRADGGRDEAVIRVSEVDDDEPFEILLSATELEVPEGSAAQISVTLSIAPLGAVVATVSHSSGDSDLAVSFGQTLVFDWSNWDTPHVILISDALDADTINGTAVFTISALGTLSDVSFTVTELDLG